MLGESASEGIRTAFNDAVKLLRDVADGRVQLDGAGGDAPAPSGGVATLAPRQVFTDRALGEYLR